MTKDVVCSLIATMWNPIWWNPIMERMPGTSVIYLYTLTNMNLRGTHLFTSCSVSIYVCLFPVVVVLPVRVLQWAGRYRGPRSPNKQNACIYLFHCIITPTPLNVFLYRICISYTPLCTIQLSYKIPIFHWTVLMSMDRGFFLFIFWDK